MNNIVGLGNVFSISKDIQDSAVLKKILRDAKQTKEQIIKDLFDKGYENYVISIGAEALDKPIRVVISIPEKSSDIEGFEYCDSSPDSGDYALFEAEMRMFEKVAPQLAEEYPDEFVATQNGKVLDHDKDELSLTKRVYSSYPHGFVLIRHTQQINIPTEVWLESPE